MSLKAIKIFETNSNILRLLSVKLKIGNIHLKTNNLQSDEEYYKDTLKQAKNLNRKYLYTKCLYNLSLFSLKKKDYETSLAYLVQVEDIEPLNDEGILKKSYCLYRLNNLDDFDILFKHYINLLDPQSPQYSELVLLNFKRHNIKDELYLKHMKKYVDNFLNRDDIERTLRFIDEIIEYYNSNHQ